MLAITHQYNASSRCGPVAVGDVVEDIGCPFTQSQRLRGTAPAAQRVRVKTLFLWGVRVCALDDPADEWDAEHWTNLTQAAAGHTASGTAG